MHVDVFGPNAHRCKWWEHWVETAVSSNVCWFAFCPEDGRSARSVPGMWLPWQFWLPFGTESVLSSTMCLNFNCLKPVESSVKLLGRGTGGTWSSSCLAAGCTLLVGVDKFFCGTERQLLRAVTARDLGSSCGAFISLGDSQRLKRHSSKRQLRGRSLCLRGAGYTTGGRGWPPWGVKLHWLNHQHTSCGCSDRCLCFNLHRELWYPCMCGSFIELPTFLLCVEACSLRSCWMRWKFLVFWWLSVGRTCRGTWLLQL